MDPRLRFHGRFPGVWSLVVAVAAVAAPAAAERVRVGPDTELSSLEFDFTQGRSFDPSELQKQMAQQPQVGHARLRGAFDFLPFVEPVVPHPLDPVELQRDVVRLREFYHRAGFPNTEVRYQVTRDLKKDAVHVRFIVTEGQPTVLSELRITGPEGTLPATWLPSDLQREWTGFAAGLAEKRGKRIGEDEKRANEAAVLDWLRNRGYAYAKVSSDLAVDLVTRTAVQNLSADPGPRARIAQIEIEGDSTVDAGVVLKTLPFTTGDWYSARRMTEGQRALANLDLFHLAIAELPQQPVDSTLQVRVRVEEGKPRLLTGELGYLSDAGLTVRGEWAHHNFKGGARTLTVAVIGQTGVWAIEANPERLLRGTVALHQPGFLVRRLSLITSPYAEYRDDYNELSWEYGLNTTLVSIDLGWARSISLQYSISASNVLEYRTGSGGDVDFFTVLEAAIDSVGTHTRHSAFTLATVLGTQDHPVKPTRALLFRPSVEVTTPSVWNTAEYARLDITTTVQHPLSRRLAFLGRLALGRVYPFGKSTGATDDVGALSRYLALRDYMFTAGGTGDVRGWADQLLGPKFPDLQTGADSTHPRADRYLPVSGLTRLAARAELRLPLPFFGSGWTTSVFVDGGRVSGAESTYLGTDPYDQQRFFYATGFGIARDTPVGPLQLSLAYKLNPSVLDVLKPQEFLDELALNGLTTVHTHWNRRLQFHFAIGTGF